MALLGAVLWRVYVAAQGCEHVAVRCGCATVRIQLDPSIVARLARKPQGMGDPAVVTSGRGYGMCWGRVASVGSNSEFEPTLRRQRVERGAPKALFNIFFAFLNVSFRVCNILYMLWTRQETPSMERKQRYMFSA